MPTHGHARDLQACRDLCRREPAAQQLEHLGLTARQLDGRTARDVHPPSQPPRAELVREHAEQLARDRRLAAPDGLERAADAGGAAALEDVAGRAGAQGVDQLVRVWSLHEEDDRRCRSTRLDEGERGDPVLALAAVDDAEVRARADRSRGGGHSVGSLRRHDEPVRLEQPPDPGANAGRRRDDERAWPRPVRLVAGRRDGMGRDLV